MKYFFELIEAMQTPNSEENTIEINVVDEIRKVEDLKLGMIKKAINDGCLKVNGMVCKTEELKVNQLTLIEFLGRRIKVASKGFATRFDKFIFLLLKGFFGSSNIEALSLSQRDKFCAYAVEYFGHFKDYPKEFEKSEYTEEIIATFKNFIKQNQLSIPDKRIAEGKEIVDHLLLIKDNSYKEFNKIIQSVLNNLYDADINRFFREYRSLLEEKGFLLLLLPLTETDIDHIKIVQKIFNEYKSVEKETEKTHRAIRCLAALKEYDDLIRLNFIGNDKISNGFKSIVNHYKDRCNNIAGFQERGIAELIITTENRTYNFTEERIVIHGYLSNTGSGIAKNVFISDYKDDDYSIVNGRLTEIIIQSDRQKIKFGLKVLAPSFSQKTNYNLTFYLNWVDERDQPQKVIVTNFNIVRQEENLPWEEVKSTNPYNLSKIDDPEKLFGRRKLLQDLQWNIEKYNSIDSYVIHGQKRVGKSSIIKTLETIYADNKNVHFIYTEVTERKGVEAIYTFNEIGKFICKNLIKDFEKKNPKFKNKLQLPIFNGSLSPLTDVIEEIYLFNNSTRIILAIDEFDELNEEFFENGTIGNVFASNIGKGLTSKKYVGTILIGSENTENKTKQGMRLNAFKFIKVDSFNKQTEFDDYCEIIKRPTEDCLSYSPEVIETLYELSNGNPYYTNLICTRIFDEAYEKRVPYIDEDFIIPISEYIINTLSTKDFEHFWKDRVSDDFVSNEKTWSRRRRILIAFAESKKEKEGITWNDVKKRLKRPEKIFITDSQFEDTLNEFIQRGIIFKSGNNALHIKPKIFENWLLQSGLYQIAAQLEDKEEVLESIQKEEKLFIPDEELRGIRNIIYGENERHHIRQIRTFLDQFENNNDKALIADLIKQIKVLHSSDLVSFLKQVYRNIWSGVSLTQTERNFRKDVEVICIDDSFEQNKPFYENILRPEFNIFSLKNLKRKGDLKSIDSEIKHVVIYEPLIDCQFYYRNEISKIIKALNPINSLKIQIHFLTFIISQEAKKEIESLMENHFSYQYSIHSCRVYERSEIAPYYNKIGEINDKTIRCLTKIYGSISENSCLVKIGEIVPYQSFPFLWCSLDNFSALINSKASIKDFEKRMGLSDQLKDLNFKSETNRIELKASLILPGVNWKKIQEKIVVLKKNTKMPLDEREKIEDEILKLYRLNLSPEEKKVTSNFVKYSIAKNLSAFSNTNGGDLFIGIEDDFTVTGLSYDMKQYDNEEAVRLEFSQLVKKYIGVEFSEYFTLQFINLDADFPVLKIEIRECKSDIWLKCNEDGKIIDDGDKIYIRTEYGTELLNSKSYHEWRNQRDKKYN